MADNEIPKEEVVEEVPSEEKVEEVVEEVVEDVVEEKKEDRPEINYKKEIERRRIAEDKLRQELEDLKKNSIQKRDPQDLTTWSDHELKAIVNSVDPSVLPYKEQANDVLLDRRIASFREKERIQEKRALSDLELKTKYPDSADPSSKLSVLMEQVMYEMDLQKTPAGRLAAAEIANARMGKIVKKPTAQGRDSSRVREVRGQMVDGDRPKPNQASNPEKKAEEVEKLIRTESITKADGISEALKMKGMDRKSFFGR